MPTTRSWPAAGPARSPSSVAPGGGPRPRGARAGRDAGGRVGPQMGRGWHGRFLPDAVLAGPETRGSSPVRIDRDPDSRESPGVRGLYPVGEGAGFAGGIVSAAVDGLRTAKA